MSLSITQTTLVRIVANQAITNNLLRLLALSPSVSISGSVATADLADGAVTAAKATPGAYFYAADASSTNTYAATYSPAVGSYANGLRVLLKITNANTSAATATFNANGLGAKNIYHRNGNLVNAGDLPANSVLDLVYNSSLASGSGGWQVENVVPSATIRPATNDTAGTANAQTVVNTPPLTAYQTGLLLLVRAGSGLTNTAAMTLNCDSLGTRNVTRPGGETLQFGDWQAGYTHLLYDDGTRFILLARERPQAIVASCRNLLIQSTSTTQATVSADEVMLKYAGAVASPTLTNGAPLLVSSVSLTIDITGGVALNSLETGGTRAISHWWFIWLISDGTNVKAVLEDAGAGDGAAPAGPDLSNAAFTGYVYLGLVGQLRLNATATGEIVPFVIRDRRAAIAETNVVNTSANSAVTSYTVLGGADLTAFRAAVPPNALFCTGIIGSNENGVTAKCSVGATDSAGAAVTTNVIGACHVVAAGAAAVYESFAAAGFFEVPVRGGAAARNIQWKVAAAADDTRININGYTF